MPPELMGGRVCRANGGKVALRQRMLNDDGLHERIVPRLAVLAKFSATGLTSMITCRHENTSLRAGPARLLLRFL